MGGLESSIYLENAEYIQLILHGMYRSTVLLDMLTNNSNCLEECCLSYLMKLVIKSPAKLSNENLDKIVDIWNRKS